MKGFNALVSILLEQLLLEAIGKTDIVDLYIILAMPKIDDPAADFIAQQVVNETSGRIIAEAEHVVLRELRHMSQESYFGRIGQAAARLKNYSKEAAAQNKPQPKSIKTVTGNQTLIGPRAGLDPDFYLDEWAQKAGKKVGLPPLIPETAPTWARLAEAIIKASKYLIKNEKGEMSLAELNQVSGYTWSFAFISRVFRDGEWSSFYGGEKWAQVATAVDNLKTSSKGQYIYNLDRLVDLVHNSGSVLNKFKSYKAGWINYILDLKQHAINLNELIPYASSEVRKLFTSPEWRTFKSKMPGGNETAGTERIILNTITKWYKGSQGRFSLIFGDIVNLILQTKYNLIDGFKNLYNSSDKKQRDKLTKAVKRMVKCIVDDGGPVMFNNPKRMQILRFADRDRFDYVDEDRNTEYWKKPNDKTRVRYTELVVSFVTDACAIIGFNLPKYLETETLRRERHGDEY